MARGKWKRTLVHVAAAKQILEPDWPMTVRQLHYCLFSLGFIENRMDKKLWQRAIEVEEVEQDSIRSFMEHWPTEQQGMADDY